jgi:transposase
MKRNRYTREFKAKVALESVKGQKTVNEWASEFGVHVSQINTWKMHLLEELPEVFGRESERREAKNEAERDAALPKSDEAANRGPHVIEEPDRKTDSNTFRVMPHALLKLTRKRARSLCGPP